jgi:hypothetical protein
MLCSGRTVALCARHIGCHVQLAAALLAWCQGAGRTSSQQGCSQLHALLWATQAAATSSDSNSGSGSNSSCSSGSRGYPSGAVGACAHT